MKTGMRLWWTILCAVVCASAGQTLWAQKAPVASRVVEQIDETRTVHIQGNVHPLARAEFDRGAVAESQPMTRMLLLLQRSTEQETALRQLLDAQQTKGSGSYHAWLTPAQFGQQFGPSDADVQAVTDWLTKQGFQVAKVSAGRTTVEFSGTAAQVQNAFQTQIHHFVVNGNDHIANISDPSIPEALSPVVAGVVALNNFPKHSMMHRVGSFQRDLATGQVKPLFTYTDLNGTFYGVGPADFATIYNIPAGADGTGQSIAVVGQSNINIQDVRDFRSMFGLPAYTSQMEQNMIVVNGPDPGILASTGDEGESDLDVEWAGAVAPAAQILFVVSQSTMSNPAQVSQGVDLSALYIVDNNLAPVMSNSYGNCEAALGSTGNSFYNALWQQATAEGITVVIAAGDNGSAGCDPNPSVNPNAASQGLAVNGFASTPYSVAVGGTDFNQSSSNFATYWNSTNAATTQLSAKGYIPEVPWDDSTCAAGFPGTPCTSVDSGGADISAGSGGASNCATFNGNGNCQAGYAKPAYQTGVTPADNVRDIPDISLFASNGFNNSFYIVCQSDANPNNAPCDLSTSTTSGTHNFQGVGGTSGGTPAFAAIIALVNQKMGAGSRQGNANYVLYQLAAKETYANCASSSFGPGNAGACVFYDITTGNNAVACVAGSPNCSNTGSSGYGVIVSGVGADHGNPAFQAVQGYDLATGLGSINVANLLNAWGSVSRTATTTALSNANATSVVSGQPFSVKVSVTPAGATGDVSLIATTSTGTAGFGPFTLSGGSVTASTSLLPPTTSSIAAYYAGDATHAASSASMNVTVTGANQTSNVTMSFVTFDANNNPVLSQKPQSITYGSPYILQVAVAPASGANSGKQCWSATTVTAFPCPTGTVTVTDNGSPLNDWPNAGTPNATNSPKLNNQGIAEDQPIQLPVGSHSIVAAYAGDPNYQPNTSNTLSVTVAKASTTTTVASSIGTITSGATVTLAALITTPSNGAGPTGNVTFTNGTATLGTGACAPTSGTSNSSGTNGTTPGTAFCTATLTTAISALYPAPQSRPRPPVVPMVLLALSIVAYLALLRWMPASRKRVYAYAGLVVFAVMAVAIAGCGGGGGGGGGGKTVTIGASYPGDANYNSSTGSTNIVVQ
jgi:pro-kumamolisin-like protein/Big-like domain-containing protein/subtilase family protein